MTTNKLVDRVLGWLDKKSTKESRNKIYFYLDDTVPAWHRLIGTLTTQNLPIVYHKLDTMKEKILRECRKNKELMDGLPDLKTTSCPGKIAELNVKVKLMKTKTSSGSNVSDSSHRRIGGGVNPGNNPIAQMEKWTSNLTKIKERRTYKASKVNLGILPKSREPYKWQQGKKEAETKEGKGPTGRKKLAVSFVEAGQQTEETFNSSRSRKAKAWPRVDSKATRLEANMMEDISSDSENEAIVMQPAAEDSISLARPNTPLKHVRGESRGIDRDSSDTRKKQDLKTEGHILQGPGEKNSSPTKWKWQLTVPPPTPEPDIENIPQETNVVKVI